MAPDQNWGPRRVQNLTLYRKMFKNLLPKNYNATVWDITLNKSMAIVDSKLLKSVPAVFLLGHRGGFKV